MMWRVSHARRTGDEQDRTSLQPTFITHHPSPITHHGRRIENAAVPIVASPSGLPSQHLVTGRDGAQHLFSGSSGYSQVTRSACTPIRSKRPYVPIGIRGRRRWGETVPIGAGVSLYIPAGEVHGFRCTEGTLHVIVVFPVPEFAETTIVE